MKKILAVVMVLVMLATFSVTAFAARTDFVPSIEFKPGPDVIEQETEGGTPAYGIIVMPDGTEVIVPSGSIIITPIVDIENATEEIRDELQQAFDELEQSGSLDELIENIQDVLDQIANGVDVEDLVITDIFHIFITEEYQEFLNQGGELHIQLDVTSDIIAALQSIEGDWSILFGENLIDNGDGTYTLVITQSGVIAFFQDAGKVDVDYNDPDQSSPQTGDFTVVLMVGSIVLFGCAMVMFAFSKKQTN